MRSGWSRLLVRARNGSIRQLHKHLPFAASDGCVPGTSAASLSGARRAEARSCSPSRCGILRPRAPISDSFCPDVRFCFTAAQGWVTAAQESAAVRISASDGFDLTSCVAPKPAPPQHDVRPQSAAPAPVLKNPYRGLVKDEKITWASDCDCGCGCSPLLPAAPAPHACCRSSASRPFPLKTRALLRRFSSGCTAPAASVQQ